MKPFRPDEIDREILRLLQQNARIAIKDIAQKVQLSSPAVSVRMEKLEEAGYITGYHAQIAPELMGYLTKAFISLEVPPEEKKEFYPYIKKCPNVVECNCVTGEYSMIIEVLFSTTMELDQFIGELQRFGRTKTMIVFSTSVDHRGLPVR